MVSNNNLYVKVKMKVVLISCVAKKRNCASLAKDLYVSPLFKGAYRYAQKLDADIIYILSAKYGLLNCNDFVQPYNKTLNTKPLKEVQQWAKEVYCQLCKVADPKTDEFVFLAGERYRKYLLPLLKNVSVPLQGMGIGKQLAFYKENA